MVFPWNTNLCLRFYAMLSINTVFQVNILFVQKIMIRNGITKICLDITQNYDMESYIYFQIVSNMVLFIIFSVFCLTEDRQSSFLLLSSFLYSVGGFCSLMCACWNISIVHPRITRKGEFLHQNRYNYSHPSSSVEGLAPG